MCDSVLACSLSISFPTDEKNTCWLALKTQLSCLRFLHMCLKVCHSLINHNCILSHKVPCQSLPSASLSMSPEGCSVTVVICEVGALQAWGRVSLSPAEWSWSLHIPHISHPDSKHASSFQLEVLGTELRVSCTSGKHRAVDPGFCPTWSWSC